MKIIEKELFAIIKFECVLVTKKKFECVLSRIIRTSIILII